MQTFKGAAGRDVARGLRREATVSCGTHSVQFYENLELFLDQLAEFAGAALGTGGSCIVIATPEHHKGVAERLRDWAVNVPQATQSGRYVALDARELLATFMVEGWPNRERFRRTIEPVLDRAAKAATRKGGLCAFGEMVSLLWEGGHREAAIQLEQLWNEICAEHRLSLLCAYPLSCFGRASDDDLFQKVCQAHDQVVPAESYTALSSDSERMRMISSLQQRAALLHNAVEERERAIAQRLHVEDKLWRSEEFARKVVGSCVDCLKVLDLEGRLEYMSPAGQAALGIRDLSSFLGRPWVELWREEDRAKVVAGLQLAGQGGVGIFQADSATSADARKHWDVRVAPMRGRDGAIERFVAVSRDISDLRQAQQIAIQAEKLAAAGRMAATIAHEINNPLEAVTNFIYLARTTPNLAEESARYLEIADRELSRVAQIAQKTLGFYRDTSSNKWISIGEVVDDVLLIYERKLRYKHIKTAIEVDPGLKVYAKQGELKQALSNLLANAIDASHDGGSIRLRAHASANWCNGMKAGIRVTLADNGSGMSPEVKKRIFVPFFTTKRDVGTGIGLWVTKSLIEQQGGYLRFRSRQGQSSGTVMSFFLPAEPPTHGHDSNSSV